MTPALGTRTAAKAVELEAINVVPNNVGSRIKPDPITPCHRTSNWPANQNQSGVSDAHRPSGSSASMLPPPRMGRQVIVTGADSCCTTSVTGEALTSACFTGPGSQAASRHTGAVYSHGRAGAHVTWQEAQCPWELAELKAQRECQVGRGRASDPQGWK